VFAPVRFVKAQPKARHCLLGFAALAAVGAFGPLSVEVRAATALDGEAAIVPASLQPSAEEPNAAAPTAPDTEIKRRLDSGTLQIGGARIHPALLQRFYANHGYDPVWESHQQQAATLWNAVLRAGEHGLDPNLFHAALMAKPAMLSPLDRELLLSDALLTYADALSRGAVPIENRMDDEDLAPEPLDVAAALDAAIAAPNPAAAIEALAPNTPDYRALQQAYAQYRSMGAQDKVRIIAVNLERLRWLPRHLPADRVEVNTANAQLQLYRGDNVVFTTRVVVGEIDKQTPEFRTNIENILFNPPWFVPPSIAAKEIFPKLASQPDYLARHNMTIRRNGGIQQLPGPKSALGQLKFEMPNRYDVYLHDTPMKSLFSLDNRRQSHGCVRVQNPRELAALLLQESVEAVNKSIAVGYTHRQSLPASLPVFVVYHTAFAQPGRPVEFRRDFYERDEALWRALSPTPQMPMAEQSPASQRRS
jgi:L,D-transpeptidase YcbB